MRVANKWQRLAECRETARQLLIENFHCRKDLFNPNLHFITEEKSGLDLMADALAASLLITHVASSVGKELQPLLPVPRYVQDPTFRRKVEGLILNFINADPKQELERANELLESCTGELEMPKTLEIYARSVHGECACRIREAVSVLGGVTKAANKLGVTPATINGWIAKGRVLNPAGLKLFELADAEEFWQEVCAPCSGSRSA